MDDYFNSMNSDYSIFRPLRNVSIGGMNNNCYLHSTINNLSISGTNLLIYANFEESRVDRIRLQGMNNTIYLNSNSINCNQSVQGINNSIIFTQGRNNNNNNNNYRINYNNNNNHYNSNNFNYNNNNNLPQPPNFGISNNNINSSVSNRNLSDPPNPLVGLNNIPNESSINNNSNAINLNDMNQNQQNNPRQEFVTLGNNQTEYELNKLPEFLYKNRSQYESNDDNLCRLCLRNFNPEDNIKMLKCGHIYHKFCLYKFSENQKINNDFPLCLVCFQWSLQDQMNQ